MKKQTPGRAVRVRWGGSNSQKYPSSVKVEARKLNPYIDLRWYLSVTNPTCASGFKNKGEEGKDKMAHNRIKKETANMQERRSPPGFVLGIPVSYLKEVCRNVIIRAPDTTTKN